MLRDKGRSCDSHRLGQQGVLLCFCKEHVKPWFCFRYSNVIVNCVECVTLDSSASACPANAIRDLVECRDGVPFSSMIILAPIKMFADPGLQMNLRNFHRQYSLATHYAMPHDGTNSDQRLSEDLTCLLRSCSQTLHPFGSGSLVLLTLLCQIL